MLPTAILKRAVPEAGAPISGDPVRSSSRWRRGSHFGYGPAALRYIGGFQTRFARSTRHSLPIWKLATLPRVTSGRANPGRYPPPLASSSFVVAL